MVLPRVLTAVVLAPVLLWVLYLGSLPFLLFMAVLIFLALWEFHQMAELGGHATQGWWGIAGAMLVVAALCFPGVRGEIHWARQGPAFAMMAAVLLWVARELARREKSLSIFRLAMSAGGLLLIAWPLGYFILLRELRGTLPMPYDAGRMAAFFLLAVIWTTDTAAWAVGMLWGKHRMAPQVSPKKSWEGAAGGLLGAVVIALFLREAFMRPLFGRWEAAALAAVLSILAQTSDLTESLFKRCFGVKDSSDLLPGHGGILDRFDSFLLSSPFFYFYLATHPQLH